MGSNQFGRVFQFTTFGESHGPAMGVVIDGCPAGVCYDEKLLLKNLASRRPGHSQGVSGRHEPDQPQILSGLYENKTLGTPIGLVVYNKDPKPQEYDSIRNNPRVGHADQGWKGKFGHWDHRGGGRASARETLNWVMAGSFAQMFCEQSHPELSLESSLVEVGGEVVTDLAALQSKLEKAQAQGESYGAVVSLKLHGTPAFLGEPVFQKAKSQLAQAYMMINACHGVELGAGFAMTHLPGTKAHQGGQTSSAYGGILGGITTGEEISFQLAFKPTSTVSGVARQGRHDPCVALRALPVVEAVTWAVLADLILLKRLNLMASEEGMC